LVSTAVQAGLFVFVLPTASRRAVDPERAAEVAWGTWLARVAAAVPLPLAVVWFGRIELAAPLSATSYLSLLCWFAFAAPLASEKRERGVRMILAPVAALAFGLVERTAVPGLYGLLFPALPLHREWFEAISWAGALLVAVPRPPSWQLPDSQVS